MTTDPTGIKMPEKLWDLANLVTGFAVAQALTTTYAVAKDEFITLRGPAGHVIAIGAGTVFGLLYTAAIQWCGREGRASDNPDHERTWRIATTGRVIAVVLFTVWMVFAVSGHWYDDANRPSRLRGSSTAGWQE